MANAQNRDTHNYYGETMLIPNAVGGFDEIYVTLTQFSLAGGRVNLTFKGWDSAENFRERARPNSRYERVFNPLITDLTDYGESVEQLKLSALDFLEMSADEWSIIALNIDIENLQITVTAKHNLRSQTTTRTVTSSEEFETLKQSNPELLILILSFWGYAKARDSFLSKLTVFN